MHRRSYLASGRKAERAVYSVLVRRRLNVAGGELVEAVPGRNAVKQRLFVRKGDVLATTFIKLEWRGHRWRQQDYVHG